MNFLRDHRFFGLDIGNRALRFVQLRPSGKKMAQLISYNEILLPPNVVTDGRVQKPDIFKTAVQQGLKTIIGKKIPTKNLISVLPETQTFVQLLTLNSVTPEELASQVLEKIKENVPLTPDEMYSDWQIVHQEGGRADVLAGAAPREIVDGYFESLRSMGLIPYVMEIEAAALCRALLPVDDQASRFIIDLGAVRTGLIAWAKGSILFTISLPISGQALTQTIAQTLNISTEEAEEAKRSCGLDPEKCNGAIRKVLDDAVTQIVSRIQQAQRFSATAFPAFPPAQEIVFCGGGANLQGLDSVLSERLRIPARPGNPLLHLTPRSRVKLPASYVPAFATAIGLALRPLQNPESV